MFARRSADAVCAAGLFYDGIGNEIGVEMAIGEASRLNVAGAVAAVKAVKDEEEEARLRAEHDQQRRAEHEETDGEPQDSAQSHDEARGIHHLLSYSHCLQCFDTVGSTWLGIRKSIGLVKTLSDEVLAWLSVWSEVQMICI